MPIRDAFLVSLCPCGWPWLCTWPWRCPWWSKLEGARSLGLVSGWLACNGCTDCRWWWWSWTWSNLLCVLVLAFDDEDSHDIPELTWWWFTLEWPVKLPDELPWWWPPKGVVDKLLLTLTTCRCTVGDPPWFIILEFDDAPLRAPEAPWWSLGKAGFEWWAKLEPALSRWWLWGEFRWFIAAVIGIAVGWWCPIEVAELVWFTEPEPGITAQQPTHYNIL